LRKWRVSIGNGGSLIVGKGGGLTVGKVNGSMRRRVKIGEIGSEGLRVGEWLSLKLCETRWVIRSYSLFTFLSAFSVVCSSFEELEHGCDAKARSNLCPITKFDFIVCLVAVQSILQPLVPISAILQTKDFDLIQAVVGSKTVIDLLQGKRRVN
jgi:hypothetical protein